jgi:hypothetical protein
MPNPQEAKRLGINPWAVCNKQGLKPGTKEFERCVHSVMASARKRQRNKRGGKVQGR